MKAKGNKVKKWMCAAALAGLFTLPLAAAVPFPVVSAAQEEQKVLEVEAVPGCSSKELQALLNSNADGQYDKLIVRIPAGTYQMTGTLYISSNTTIIAAKDAYLKKQKVYGAMLEGKLVQDKGGYGGCQDIVIEGGVWDSEPVMKGKEGTETFRFIHCSNVTVKDAVLCNVPEGSHLIVFSGTRDALVENCEFYGYGKGRGGKIPKEAVQLDIAHDVVTTPTEQEVFWDELPCCNITVQNCNFHDFSRAFGSHTTVKGIYHDGIVLKDNTINNMSDIAFKLFNYTNTVVEGNTFENCGWGVFAYTWLDLKEVIDEESSTMFLKPLTERKIVVPENCNIVIEKNVFRMGTGVKGVDGDAVRICGSEELLMSGVTVKDNEISGGRRYGVFATHAPNLVVSGNQISDTKSNGILIEEGCTESVIRDNVIKNAGGKAAIGVYTASDGTLVAGNEITSPKESGIYLYSNVKNCIVGAADKGKKDADKNRIVKPGTTGIHITNGCTKNTIAYNEVENAKGTGIWVYSSTDNKILGNTIASPGENGIHVTVKSSGNTLESNTITKPGVDGVRLHDSQNCSVVSNTISSPKKNGINVTEKSNKAVIKKNKISSAGEDGIWVSGSASCTVSSNTIKGYAAKAEKNYGIGIYQSGGTKSANTKVESNTITGSGKKTTNDAIRVSTSDYVLVNKNTIKTPAGCGIYIYTSKNSKASSNKITKPVMYGIYATTACDKAKITGNTVTTPGKTAIMTYQAAGSEVSSNIVKVSAGIEGIRISQSNKTVIQKNKITATDKNLAIKITGSEGCTEKNNTIK